SLHTSLGESGPAAERIVLPRAIARNPEWPIFTTRLPLVFGGQTMQPQDFAEFHQGALERDEARHNVILAILGRLASDNLPDLRLWTLVGPGECAIQSPRFPIVLGEVAAAQCRALAEETRALDYPGVVGPDQTAQWFAERAAELGVTFREPIPQQIHALRDR